MTERNGKPRPDRREPGRKVNGHPRRAVDVNGHPIDPAQVRNGRRPSGGLNGKPVPYTAVNGSVTGSRDAAELRDELRDAFGAPIHQVGAPTDKVDRYGRPYGSFGPDGFPLPPPPPGLPAGPSQPEAPRRPVMEGWPAVDRADLNGTGPLELTTGEHRPPAPPNPAGRSLLDRSGAPEARRLPSPPMPWERDARGEPAAPPRGFDDGFGPAGHRDHQPPPSRPVPPSPAGPTGPSARTGPAQPAWDESAGGYDTGGYQDVSGGWDPGYGAVADRGYGFDGGDGYGPAAPAGYAGAPGGEQDYADAAATPWTPGSAGPTWYPEDVEPKPHTSGFGFEGAPGNPFAHLPPPPGAPARPDAAPGYDDPGYADGYGYDQPSAEQPATGYAGGYGYDQPGAEYPAAGTGTGYGEPGPAPAGPSYYDQPSAEYPATGYDYDEPSREHPAAGYGYDEPSAEYPAAGYGYGYDEDSREHPAADYAYDEPSQEHPAAGPGYDQPGGPPAGPGYYDEPSAEYPAPGYDQPSAEYPATGYDYDQPGQQHQVNGYGPRYDEPGREHPAPGYGYDEPSAEYPTTGPATGYGQPGPAPAGPGYYDEPSAEYPATGYGYDEPGQQHQVNGYDPRYDEPSAEYPATGYAEPYGYDSPGRDQPADPYDREPDHLRPAAPPADPLVLLPDPPLPPPPSHARRASTPPVAQPAQILDRGYRSYDGPRRGRIAAMRSVYRESVRKALGLKRGASAKAFPVFAGFLAYLPAIVFVGMVAVMRDKTPQDLARFIEQYMPSYGFYYTYILFAIVVFVAFVTPEVLCTDRRNGLLPLYLASPLDRVRYLLAKAVAVAVAMSVVTVGPPLIFLLGRVLNGEGPDGLDGFVTIFGKVVASGAIITVPYLALSFAVSSTTTRRADASAGIVFLLSTAWLVPFNLMKVAGLNPHVLLFDIVQLPLELVSRLYGPGDKPLSVDWRQVPTPTLVAGYAAWIAVFSLFALFRYRRIQVTR
jgi:ABC-2 type transport system permease protein